MNDIVKKEKEIGLLSKIANITILCAQWHEHCEQRVVKECKYLVCFDYIFT